jgi:NAD-reducing hydrogenase large subunit
MERTITIDPVTRIGVQGKITIQLDDADRVADARFHLTEFRGFEKFCEGRTFPEMPGITMHISGICPVSHMLASAKAGDAIQGIKVPATAVKLRRLINWAEYVQSHAFSFFHLSAPDLLLGMESNPANRSFVGLMFSNPQLARKGIRLRAFGQEIIRMVTGKSVHPSWATPGGVREPLTGEHVVTVRAGLPEAFDTTLEALKLLKDRYSAFTKEVAFYGNFPSLWVGMVTPEGGLEHYDGLLRVKDAEGNILEKGLSPELYGEIIAEAVECWSYMKFPYYKPNGYNASGMYRSGPLARLNICDYAGTPIADEELYAFRKLASAPGKPVNAMFYAHYARLIELIFALEKIAQMIEDPDILSSHIRAAGTVNEFKGVGIVEAPQGTLIHEYHVDPCGVLTRVNLVTPGEGNNLAMNKTIKQIADGVISGNEVTEGRLNRVEHGIRLYF